MPPAPRRPLTSLCLATALAAGACSGPDAPADGSAGRTITIVSPSAPTDLDPYSCTGAPDQNILGAAYDTLLRLAPDGTVHPSLATSWHYRSPVRFDLQLRTGVTFADGTPLDAQAVKRNLDRAGISSGAATADFAVAVQSIETDGPTRVVITLNRPYPDLPATLAGCGGMIVNPERLVIPEALASTVDGSGPYTYDAALSTPGTRYVFHRRKDYWDHDAYPFENAVFQVLPDIDAGYDALAAGRVDIATGSSAAVPKAARAGLESTRGQGAYYLVNLLDRDGTRVPALKDVRVRRALNYAVDRSAIDSALFGGAARPTVQIVPPTAQGYDAALDDAYPHDAAKARQLLTQAGYPNGFTLQVLTTGSFKCDVVLHAVVPAWAAIGVKVEEVVKPYDEYLQSLASRVYPAVVLPTQGTPPYTALVENFGERSRRNPFRSTDPAFTAALRQAQDATSPKAAAGLRDMSARLIDQAWYVGVGFVTVTWFYDPKKVTTRGGEDGGSGPRLQDWQPAQNAPR
ncbi:peptide ABC transporter substrate-binding protein [Kitasatospora sp. NE20-6]|uniref:ABC transporter substrate-binding protein n=1 Tax=Kitasatospora sp. NE20-6 TaxID=2859066 RepID=UPI0034DC21D9